MDTFCDVTIDLDDQHTIIGDCHALAAMLMHGTVVSLKGRKLQEFMANKQDQDQYEGQLSFGSFRVDGPAVKSMSIRMKDGCGGILASEMFKTSYLGMCGELRHLVGIREFADAPPLFPMRQRPSFTGRKRQNSMENKGTPSILGKESLPEKHYTSETESSEIGSEMCADEDLAIPELSRTSDEATRWILERAMAQVNWKLAESNCCRYHGYVRELKQFIKRLNKKVCCPHFADNADDFFQCETCGLLSYAEEAECASGKVKCLACSSNSFLSFPTSNEPALSPLTSL